MEDWRRIDIDKYDPDYQYIPDDLKLPNLSIAQIEPAVQQIRALISRNSTIEAIKLAVSNPPYGSDIDVKLIYLTSVLEIFNNTKQSEIQNVIDGLDIDEIDVLIKFIYKLMSLKEGQKFGGILLSWFDKVIEKVGEGPIVRYMSDPYQM